MEVGMITAITLMSCIKRLNDKIAYYAYRVRNSFTQHITAWLIFLLINRSYFCELFLAEPFLLYIFIHSFTMTFIRSL